eukprot:6370367-Amphidinium_carterae.2
MSSKVSGSIIVWDLAWWFWSGSCLCIARSDSRFLTSHEEAGHTAVSCHFTDAFWILVLSQTPESTAACVHDSLLSTRPDMEQLTKQRYLQERTEAHNETQPRVLAQLRAKCTALGCLEWVWWPTGGLGAKRAGSRELSA